MAKINWTCPECGGHDIVQRICGQDLHVPVTRIDLDRDEVEYDFNNQEWGENEGSDFACAECGYVISEGSDEESFIAELEGCLEPDDPKNWNELKK